MATYYALGSLPFVPGEDTPIAIQFGDAYWAAHRLDEGRIQIPIAASRANLQAGDLLFTGDTGDGSVSRFVNDDDLNCLNIEVPAESSANFPRAGVWFWLVHTPDDGVTRTIPSPFRWNVLE